MDYSLLLAVIDNNQPLRSYEFNDKEIAGRKYAIGLIDFT